MIIEIKNLSDFIISVLIPFGGWAVVISAFISFLACLWAKRTLQKEAKKITEKLSHIGHELKLRESSYEKHLDLLLDYYSVFYRHYRLCQNATNQDAHSFDDGTTIRTKDIFFEKLDNYLLESSANEGKTRLVLPTQLLEFHEQSIKAFNEFKDAMKRTRYDDDFHAAKRDAFEKINNVKNMLETGLRDFFTYRKTN